MGLFGQRRIAKPRSNRFQTHLHAVSESLEVRRLLAGDADLDAQPELQSIPIGGGFNLPVFATFAPNEPNNLYVVELSQARIMRVDLLTDVQQETPFLSVPGVSTGGEKGLLGMAFSPDYETSGLFYVFYTNMDNMAQIDSYRRSETDPTIADPDSRQTILRTRSPQPRHYGGWLGFGPDGYLYIAFGDNSNGNDEGPSSNPKTGNAQDITVNLAGKILRVDPTGDDFNDLDRNYAIPPTNPFVGIEGDDEIWAYGLRNPFRASFDRVTGDLIIGDVGERAREEISVAPAGVGGLNFGWANREGTIASASIHSSDKPEGAIDPVYNYERGSGPTQGRSVVGGYVYNGPVDGLQGRYFFGDFSTSRVWSINLNGDDPKNFDGTNFTDFVDWTANLQPESVPLANIVSFAEDFYGNLYIIAFGGQNVYRITGDVKISQVKRSFNPNANIHFFTGSESEFQAVVDSGYRDESSAPSFSVYERATFGTTPIYRLYNPNLGTHYYTIDIKERDVLVEAGWNSEGILGYGFANQEGKEDRVEVFRLYNKDSGTHLFTVDPQERDGILEAFPGVWEQHASLGFGFAAPKLVSNDPVDRSTPPVTMTATAESTTELADATSGTELVDTRIGATSAPVAATIAVDSTPTSDDTGTSRKLAVSDETDDPEILDSVFAGSLGDIL